MTRDQLHELGYIVPIDSVPSILQHGILSHNRARRIQHEDIALPEVQERRSRVIVPAPTGGRRLHDYANLYISPRNPMLYVRRNLHERICVLRVSVAVLDLPGVIVTDANAGSGYTAFRPAPDGLDIVNADITFARYWTHADPIEQYRRRSAKCAEVLVPDRVETNHITGAYVSCDAAQNHLREVAPALPSIVNRDLFFL